MSKCKQCNDTGYYYCPFMLMEEECVRCDASKKLSNEAVEAAVLNAMSFGAPDLSGGFTIEDGVVYFKDKLGHTSLMMEEDAYNAFVKQSKKQIDEIRRKK